MKSKNKENTFNRILKILTENKKKIPIIAIPIIALITFILFLSKVQFNIIVTFLVFSGSSLLLSYFSVDYNSFLNLKKAEKNYPDFLEDLAEAKSSGMTMAQSIRSCAGGQYGELMPYIRKINTQISWGMPFNKAWSKFSDKVKNSKLMYRFNTIILESIESGADTAKILASLASRADDIRSIENSRKGIMRQQVVMLYVIFFGFLGIIVLLKSILLPTLYIQNLGAEGLSSVMESSSTATLDSEYFKQLFMFIILAQSGSTGVLVGQIMEDRLIGGIKHIAILLAVGILIFMIFINPVSLSVNQYLSSNSPYRGEEINIGGDVSIDGSPGGGVNITISIESMEPIKLTTGSQGRFYKEFEAPAEPGTYNIKTKVQYNKKTKVVEEVLVVE